jgi:beta-galactosidase
MKGGNSMGRLQTLSLGISLMMGAVAVAAEAPLLRRTISLDGIWQVEQGEKESAPKNFTHTVVVPGLIDMAEPRFTEVGERSSLREAFWYRRNFRLEGPLPAVAMLKISKAMYGSRVILNGVVLGDLMANFTPGHFDVREALRSGENEIVVRVGASPESMPKFIPWGWDPEKKLYIPGIVDSVELILSGSPHIARVQVVPNIEDKSVDVHAWVRHAGVAAAANLHFTVREASTGQVVGEGDCGLSVDGKGSEQTGHATIPLKNCRLWSPDDPFLYNLESRGAADVVETRFGMRTFRFDSTSGRAILNGRPYFMRGTNVTVYRFYEDSQRGDKPWREDWVRRLHKAFRNMHWNSVRYCVGFPPESWYRIADEEGLLIQDEFPIGDDGTAEIYNVGELERQFTAWMQQRWNHPSVVIWDACNEALLPETGQVIAKVRGLDLSNRPWDNGWATPAKAGDSRELHAYHFSNPGFRLAGIARDSGSAEWAYPPGQRPGQNAVILNEYGFLWLNRDGEPTTLTRRLYQNLLGPHATIAQHLCQNTLGPGLATAQRRRVYARYLAAETEFWRSHRKCAAVLHFCGLGYSRPDGQTSDHWMDVEKLTWEPEFYNYVRDAFAPVGLMIDAWEETYPAGPREFPVVVINDLYGIWKGDVRLRLSRDGQTVVETSQSCEVEPLGRLTLKLAVDIPAQPGYYQVEAALVGSNVKPVRSLRDFDVVAK